MRFWWKRTLAGLLLAGQPMLMAAQTAPKPAAKTQPWKTYCHPQEEFCFKYPANWMMLGEIFEGSGVVVAPAQKQEHDLWDEVTVALVVPAPDGDEEPVTVGETIAKAVSRVRKTGQSFETLQRQQRTVDGKPAESVKLKYTDQATGHEWIEELVFIEGPDSEIYSVALKSSPATLAQMEPAFQRMVESWKLPAPAPPPGNVEPGAATKPKTTPVQPKTAAPPKPQG